MMMQKCSNIVGRRPNMAAIDSHIAHGQWIYAPAVYFCETTEIGSQAHMTYGNKKESGDVTYTHVWADSERNWIGSVFRGITMDSFSSGAFWISFPVHISALHTYTMPARNCVDTFLIYSTDKRACACSHQKSVKAKEIFATEYQK